jgi:hypothetical protein
MKKDYFLIIDTETTTTDMVADFGAVLVDKTGKIYASCAVLVEGFYDDPDAHPLFHFQGGNELWAKKNLDSRYERYENMLDSGTRIMGSVKAINSWLKKVKDAYDPYVTAYNLKFDQAKCSNTGIDMAMFGAKQFCLWYAAAAKWSHTKSYLRFIVETHAFNAPTKLRNMTYKTNAETMTRFVLNDPNMVDEPHTSLEDAVFYELPILLKLLKSERKKNWLNPKPYSWHFAQVKDHFGPK